MDSSVLGQVRCLGSIAFTVPQETVKFKKFRAKDCIEWLRAGEEEEDEEVCVLKEARQLGLAPHYHALAILANQAGLHPENSSKEPFVGVGVVYISPYIVGVSFSTTYLALSNWAGNKKAIADPHLLFVYLDPTSELMPPSVGYPIYLDLAKEEFKDKGEPKYWPTSKLRAFDLQTISLPVKKGAARESFVM